MKKTTFNQPAVILGCLLGGLLLSGCAQFEEWSRIRPSPIAAELAETSEAKPPEAPAAEPAEAPAGQRATAQPAGAREFGPAFAIIEVGGVCYLKSAMVFPTGHPESSGLLVEKMVPVEVFAGQPFEYQYKVSNLTEYPIHKVTVSDRLTGSFTAGEVEPTPSDTREGVVTWELGTLAAKESKVIRVRASGNEEGALNTCGWASFSRVLCEDIKVVKPAVELRKKAPAEALICDPIPVTVTVKNTGSGLTDIKVTDALPEGLLSEGKNSLTFEADELAPGQSRHVSATFVSSSAESFQFNGRAKGTCAKPVSASGQTRVVGLSALLLEKADDVDPVPIGETTTYTVKITDQGTAEY